MEERIVDAEGGQVAVIFNGILLLASFDSQINTYSFWGVRIEGEVDSFVCYDVATVGNDVILTSLTSASGEDVEDAVSSIREDVITGSTVDYVGAAEFSNQEVIGIMEV